MFVFDYFTERAFYMELKEIITGKTLKDPLCTRKEGKAPRQKMTPKEIDAASSKVAKKSTKDVDDLDLNFYGDSAYNEDELGEGFDDLNF
jgi:hypothetical protein